jgi:hypothetical protein
MQKPAQTARAFVLVLLAARLRSLMAASLRSLWAASLVLADGRSLRSLL